MTDKLLLTIPEAASLTPFGDKTIRAAIKATDPAAFPPPLKAKRGSRGQYLVRVADLEAWIDSLQDA
jgi:predicted DNA-binding transcriptional regulator AlpA